MRSWFGVLSLYLATVVLTQHGTALPLAAAPPAKPNILFIAIDDMRDWTGYTGHPLAKTPNLDRLARTGMAFTRAYTASALCNPSRTALLSGLRPGTTGVYSNNVDWRDVLSADTPTLPGYFRSQGWRTMTAGKIFHGGRLRRDDWDDFLKDNEREERDNDRNDLTLKPGKTPGAFTIGTNVIEPLDSPEEDLVDYKTASFGIERLRQSQNKPFFLACGFHRPHLPLSVPRKYFDLFPLDKIELPVTQANDLADLPRAGVVMAKPGEFAAIKDLGKWREHVRAYLAAIAYTDAQVGRLLDALEQSPHKNNTIICLWSDHGWHHGEKEHWRKSTLWEEATRSPLLWVVPGVTKAGSVCSRPVDFLGIYPTLCDLAGLPLPGHLQGASLKPLLSDPAAAWERPAISTMKQGNHAVRTDRWRYIRYAGGGDELYDEHADPHEWTNLASRPEHAALKAELAKWLPTENKPEPATAKSAAKAKAKKKKNP
jgi:arylsulfatase A-like enzyme